MADSSPRRRLVAITIVLLGFEETLKVPRRIGTFQVIVVLSCEEAWFPERDVRLCVFTEIAPYSLSEILTSKKTVDDFIPEFRGIHGKCEFWACTAHKVTPQDPFLSALGVTKVLDSPDLVQNLEQWCLRQVLDLSTG